jgi:hypothetical protein
MVTHPFSARASTVIFAAMSLGAVLALDACGSGPVTINIK